jgi:hypothetical protein
MLSKFSVRRIKPDCMRLKTDGIDRRSNWSWGELMKTWWMLAVRGGLGILLGLSVLLTPGVGLGELVVLFGSYAILDGLWAVGWALRASQRPLEGWPVVLEGILSLAAGVVALGFPFEAAGFVHVIAPWGVVTGMLEILAGLRLPQGRDRSLGSHGGGRVVHFPGVADPARAPCGHGKSRERRRPVRAHFRRARVDGSDPPSSWRPLGRSLVGRTSMGGRSPSSWTRRRSTMRLHLAVLLGAVLALSPFDGIAQEKQIADVKELAGIWRGRATRGQEQEPVTMIVAADGSYRAMTTAEASTEGKFYLQDGTLRYRSSRTLGTAVVAEDGGNTLLRMTPDELNYRAGRAEYERVK